MAIALVAHTEKSLGTNGGTTVAIDTTGANLIVLAIAYDNGGPIPTISDSKTNTWTGLTAITGTFNKLRIYYCANATVDVAHTFTASGSNQFSAIAVAAFSGAATSSPFDLQSGNFGASPIQPGSITPSVANCLVYGAGSVGNNSGNTTSVSGLTLLGGVGFAGGSAYGISHGYIVQTSATAINPTWTNSAGQLDAVQASFKPPVVGGSPLFLPSTLSGLGAGGPFFQSPLN